MNNTYLEKTLSLVSDTRTILSGSEMIESEKRVKLYLNLGKTQARGGGKMVCVCVGCSHSDMGSQGPDENGEVEKGKGSRNRRDWTYHFLSAVRFFHLPWNKN